MVSEPRTHIERIRKDFEASQRVKDSLNNSIQALATDLYSKETHFIFELIQNAEDNTYKKTEPSLSLRLAKADPTNSQNAVGALIIQNNEIGFFRDNVDAICAVGKTTKSKIKGYIGEKGIGFKSVFRITTMPHIFSGGYQFCFPEKDEETGLGYILPRWVENIPLQIDPDQTTIILPLNKPDFGYERIEEMLRDIEPETILFLSKLKKIQISTDTGEDLTILKDDTKNPRVQLFIEGKRRGKPFSNINEFLLYTKTVDKPKNVNHEKRIGINKRDISIAFPLDESKESAGKIFAYLPVRCDIGLPFLINADFILPSSREEIRPNVPWNKWLMDCVASLLTDALPRLKEEELLTVDLLEALAKRMNELDENNMFYPIVGKLREALMDQELLPADDGTFVSARNAKLARPAELRKLITRDKLRKLFQSDDDIKWLSGDITQDLTPDLRSYLMSELDVAEIRPERFAQLITDALLERQTDDWIIQFYNFLGKDQSELWKKPNSILRYKRILRLEDNSHVIPFQPDGRPNAYLPFSSKTDFPTIKKEIFDDKGAEEFLRNLGLFEPDLFAEVIEFVLPKYTEESSLIDFQENIEDIEKINELINTSYEDAAKSSIGKLGILLSKLGLENFASEIGQISNLEPGELIPLLLKAVFPRIRFLRAVSDNKKEYKSANEIYLNTNELHMYFENNPNAWFIDESYPPDLESLFNELSIGEIPSTERKTKNDEGYVIIRNSHSWHDRGLKGFDPDIEVDGLEYALKDPTIEKSLFIWNRIAIANADCIRGTVESSSRQTYENSDKVEQVSQKFGRLLIDTPWLPDKQGNFHKPGELNLEVLPESFELDEKLANQLGMKKDVVAKLAEEAGISQDTINIAKELEKHPKWLAEFRKKIHPVAPDEESTESETGPDKLDFKGELESSFNRPGKTKLHDQITDSGKVTNPDHRRDKSYQGHKTQLQNEPSPNKRRKETIRTILEGPDEQVREYLIQMYGGKCQICRKTFAERNGNPFFIANRMVHRKIARFVDTPANALCLCANHFAKWQHGAIEAADILEQIKNFKTESEDGDGKSTLNIMLCGEECKVDFKEKHLLDLQELLMASTGDN